MLNMSALKWKKRGQVFSFTERNFDMPWMVSHCQNPSVVVFDNHLRVYFNTRPRKELDGHISYPIFVDLNKNDPQKIINVAEKPVLGLGEPGCFDQFGCMSGNVINNREQLWMYYVGWMRCVGVPYNWAIGLATSSDGGSTFERMFKGPIIGAQFNEPYLQNGNFVVRESADCWHMWYSTGKDWLLSKGRTESRYIIVYANSNDGIHWDRNGEPIIPYAFEDETLTTPTVFKHNGKYHMIFSSRHSTDFRNAERGYRLGYAWSENLAEWYRDDSKVGIELSKSGWDSEMICYPHVCNVGSKIFMFYCGNNFGEDGFGYAELEV